MKLKKIDYGDISEELYSEYDKKAYYNYYNKNIIIDEICYDDSLFMLDDDILSFNDWYCTDIHQNYITLLLRKRKLEKINKE